MVIGDIALPMKEELTASNAWECAVCSCCMLCQEAATQPEEARGTTATEADKVRIHIIGNPPESSVML
eukprot:1143635-Amphidinium_carterae.2